MDKNKKNSKEKSEQVIQSATELEPKILDTIESLSSEQLRQLGENALSETIKECPGNIIGVEGQKLNLENEKKFIEEFLLIQLPKSVQQALTQTAWSNLSSNEIDAEIKAISKQLQRIKGVKESLKTTKKMKLDNESTLSTIVDLLHIISTFKNENPDQQTLKNFSYQKSEQEINTLIQLIKDNILNHYNLKLQENIEKLLEKYQFHDSMKQSIYFYRFIKFQASEIKQSLKILKNYEYQQAKFEQIILKKDQRLNILEKELQDARKHISNFEEIKNENETLRIKDIEKEKEINQLTQKITLFHQKIYIPDRFQKSLQKILKAKNDDEEAKIQQIQKIIPFYKEIYALFLAKNIKMQAMLSQKIQNQYISGIQKQKEIINSLLLSQEALLSEVQQLKSKIEEEEQNSLQSTVEKLENQLVQNEYIKQVKMKLEEEIRWKDEELFQLKGQNGELNQLNQQLKRQIFQLSQEKDKIISKSCDERVQKQTLKNKLNQHINEKSSLTAQHTSKIKLIANENQSLKRQIEQLSNQNQKFQSFVKSMEEEVKNLKQQLRITLEQKLAQLQSLMEELKIERQLKQSNERQLERRSEQIQQFKQKQEQMINQIQGQLSQLVNQNYQLKIKLSVHEEETKQISKQLGKRKELIENKEKQLIYLKQNNEKYKNVIDSFIQMENILRVETEALKQKIQHYKKQHIFESQCKEKLKIIIQENNQKQIIIQNLSKKILLHEKALEQLRIIFSTPHQTKLNENYDVDETQIVKTITKNVDELLSKNRQLHNKIQMLENHTHKAGRNCSDMINYFLLLNEKMENLMKFLVSENYILNGEKFVNFTENSSIHLIRVDDEEYFKRWLQLMKQLFSDVYFSK